MPRPVPSRRLSRLSLRGEGAGGSSRDRRRLRRLRDIYGYPDLHRPEPQRRERIRGRWGVYFTTDLDTDEGYRAFDDDTSVALCYTCRHIPCACVGLCHDGSGLEWDNYQSGTGGLDDVR